MRAGLGVLALVVFAAGCGGGEDPERASVRGYIEETNAVQARFAGDFKRADAAFEAFANGEVTGASAVSSLERAEQDIRGAQAALSALTVPAPAADVHDRLVRLYAVDADLAHETLGLALYRRRGPASLKPLDKASKRLRGALRDARRPASQARALSAFSSALLRTLNRLEAMEVPQILVPSHRAQITRLKTTRRLTGQLRDAVRDRDSRRVGRLLLKFRAGGEAAASQRALMKEGAAAYTGRLARLAQAQAELGRAEARLRRSVR